MSAAQTQPDEVAPTQPYEVAQTQPHEVAPTQLHEVAPTQPYEVAPTQLHEVAPTQPYEVAPTQPYEVAPTQLHEVAPPCEVDEDETIPVSDPSSTCLDSQYQPGSQTDDDSFLHAPPLSESSNDSSGEISEADPAAPLATLEEEAVRFAIDRALVDDLKRSWRSDSRDRRVKEATRKIEEAIRILKGVA